MYLLHITGLSKTYYSAKGLEVVFEDYQKQFKTNRVCLTGKNGSGKSTLLLMIAGLVTHDSGQFLFADSNNAPTYLSDKERVSSIALASDSLVFPSFLTAHEILNVNNKMWAKAWPNDLIEQFEFMPHLQKNVSSLSAGNLKKLQLIYAFMRQPSILLLDEPNLALDSRSVNALWDNIEQFKGMVICASNEPDLYVKNGFAVVPLRDVSNAISA